MIDEDDDDGPFVADPEEDLAPAVEVPTVRNPAESLPDPSTVDSDVSGPFVTAVLYANVALFGVSLGLMLVGFRGEWRSGGVAVAVGLFAAVRVYQTYRSFERARESREAGAEDPPDGPDGPDDPGPPDGH